MPCKDITGIHECLCGDNGKEQGNYSLGCAWSCLPPTDLGQSKHS